MEAITSGIIAAFINAGPVGLLALILLLGNVAQWAQLKAERNGRIADLKAMQDIVKEATKVQAQSNEGREATSGALRDVAASQNMALYRLERVVALLENGNRGQFIDVTNRRN